MIVVEGPDGCGKTTLIGQIQEWFPQLTLSDHGPRDELPNKGVRDRVYNALSDAVRGSSSPRLHDRLYLSELVYGPVLRGTCEFTEREQRFIEGVLHVLSCPVIVCLPPLDISEENVSQGHHIPGAAEKHYAIHASYGLLVRRGGYNIRVYDYTESDELGEGAQGMVRATIAFYLANREEREWSPL